jgi:DNA ligase-1
MTFKAVMLAHTWDAQVDPCGWWVSIKKDGLRCVSTGDGKLYSRQGNLFHKVPAWFLDSFPKDIMLDGELSAGTSQFQRSIDIVKQQGSCTADDFKEIKYDIFDAPMLPGTFEERIAAVTKIVQDLHCPYLKVLPQIVCKGHAHLQQMLQHAITNKEEGLIVRDPNSLYEFGKRSKSMLKVKKFDSLEARVTAHLAGKGRLSNMCGKLTCELPCGVTFNTGSGLNDALRAKPPKIGSIVEIKHQGHTKSGKPRFPIFLRVRTDITWADVCKRVGSVVSSFTTPCRYGSQCYRKNDQHLKEYSH